MKSLPVASWCGLLGCRLDIALEGGESKSRSWGMLKDLRASAFCFYTYALSARWMLLQAKGCCWEGTPWPLILPSLHLVQETVCHEQSCACIFLNDIYTSFLMIWAVFCDQGINLLRSLLIHLLIMSFIHTYCVLCYKNTFLNTI